jgi:Holliday junction DNA helicase RuvB
MRPEKLKDIIGQNYIKQSLEILLKSRINKDFPHCIFIGPPGLGKTTFATVIARERNSKVFFANGGNIKKQKDVLPYLVKLKKNDTLFIDEIHRVSKCVQEQLFTAMEDFRFDVSKNAYSFKLDSFTLFGATTEPGLLLRPFYDRFEHSFYLDYYTVNEIVTIVKNNSQKIDVNITDRAALMIAKRSRFTPRISNSLLKWCKDVASHKNSRQIDDTLVDAAMTIKEIDENGLDNSDKKYIMVLKQLRKPVGLNTLMSMTGLSKETIELQIEPFLFKMGMVEKTPKGRVLV